MSVHSNRGAPRVAVLRAPHDVDERRLHPAERAVLAGHDLISSRRDEWIAGRLALRALLGGRACVIAAADGAPICTDGRAVSISHEGEWLAVATSSAPVGVDLALRAHSRRLARVLARIDARTGSLEPAQAWAALESVLKLRRRGVGALLGARLWLRPAPRAGRRRLARAVEVRGLGAPAFADIFLTPAFALAVARER